MLIFENVLNILLTQQNIFCFL